MSATPPGIQSTSTLVSNPVHAGEQKRKSQRFAYTVRLTARLLDNEFAPLSNDFSVTARNLSQGGLAVLHEQPIEADSVLGLDLHKDDGTVIRLAMRVLRCVPHGGLYEIAGNFITKL